MFITFEGLDFCGKSTQVKLIKKYFEDSGEKVELIREPGGVQISEKVRNILLDNKNSEMFSETELLLFSASRAQLVREKIIPYLKSGKVVISDRFLDSSIAYQGFGRGLNKEFVIDLQKFAIGEAVPDITFFIDIPIAEVMKRKNNILQSDLDRIEVSENEFYENVKKGYEYLAKIEERIITIDGTKSIIDIHNEIISIISKH
ncbi:MAG: dTMP kinase [Melioribacteraceae bacterium]|nr:dTMP kinase [Melioribacteraceae bacterium]